MSSKRYRCKECGKEFNWWNATPKDPIGAIADFVGGLFGTGGITECPNCHSSDYEENPSYNPNE